MSRLFYLVNLVEEMRFRPTLTEDQTKIKEPVYLRFRGVVAPPSTTETPEDYVVVLYAVREQALERLAVTVTHTGDLTTAVTVLAQDVPLVYGLSNLAKGSRTYTAHDFGRRSSSARAVLCAVDGSLPLMKSLACARWVPIHLPKL